MFSQIFTILLSTLIQASLPAGYIWWVGVGESVTLLSTVVFLSILTIKPGPYFFSMILTQADTFIFFYYVFHVIFVVSLQFCPQKYQ